MKVRIRLDTMKEITQFVAICSKIPADIHITDGAGLKVSAKSVIGVMYSMEFDDIWCECEQDIYSKIEKFIMIE